MLVLVTADSIREDEVYGLFYNVTEPVHLMISAIDRRIITTEMSDFYLCIFFIFSRYDVVRSSHCALFDPSQD